MGMARGGQGGGGIAAAIQRGRQQRAGPRGGMAGLVGDARQQQGMAQPRGPVNPGPMLQPAVPGGGGGGMVPQGRGTRMDPIQPNRPQLQGRMQQQQALAQRMRRGATPNAPNPTGNRLQNRRGMGGYGGGGRRY